MHVHSENTFHSLTACLHNLSMALMFLWFPVRTSSMCTASQTAGKTGLAGCHNTQCSVHIITVIIVMIVI